MDVEKWRSVPGFAEYYEASNHGRLRRIATHKGRPKCSIIVPHSKAHGYDDYWLFRDGNRPKRVAAHRLIWQTFVGEIPAGLEINHKNGERRDNRLSNLEVVTRSENKAHSFRVLGRPAPNYPSFGERNGSAKLTAAEVQEIRRMRQSGVYQHEIAKKFGVTQRVISLIERKLLWSHVTD